jgi:hypothetical protein
MTAIKVVVKRIRWRTRKNEQGVVGQHDDAVECDLNGC